MIPKFRAWDKLNESMCDVANIDFMTKVVELRHAVPFYFLPFSEVALMQYTGLKDKNGVEIYEGDIVCSRYANFYTPIFRNGIYMAYNVEHLNLTKQEPSTQFNVVWKNGCEVIGNIYENPELLEVAE